MMANPLTVQRMHQEIEAGRLAYRDRNLYLADPAQADVPVDWLLSAEHAREVRQAIDPERALDPLPAFSGPRHEDTVYISVVDKDRNACSFINTLFNGFGAVLMAPDCGVMLQNRGQGFVLDPGHPNCIAPGKRPLHTIIPGLVAKDGRAVMPYGVMGGQYQAFGHMQFLTRFLDYSLDIQEANVEIAQQREASIQAEPGRADVRQKTDAINQVSRARDNRDQSKRDLEVAILGYLLATGQLRVDTNGRLSPLTGMRLDAPGAAGEVE